MILHTCMQARGAEAYGKSAKEASESIYRLPMQPLEFMNFLTSWNPKPIKPRASAVRAVRACSTRCFAQPRRAGYVGVARSRLVFGI